MARPLPPPLLLMAWTLVEKLFCGFPNHVKTNAIKIFSNRKLGRKKGIKIVNVYQAYESKILNICFYYLYSK